MRRGIHRWATVVAMILVVTGSAAAPAQASDGELLDLSSRTAIEDYLVSLGLDPSGAIYQEGANNYAGPNCPGDGWSCVEDVKRIIVQLLTGDGQNVVDCSGEASGTSCVVVQSSTTGSNTARCAITTTDNPVRQSCSITQVSTSGANSASVEMNALQRDGGTQYAEQDAYVRQQSDSGANDLKLSQSVEQSSAITTVGNVAQQQDAYQFSVVDQDSTSGAQTIDARQLGAANAYASTSDDVSQAQNTLDRGPNVFLEIDQHNGSGSNDSRVAQDMRLTQDAESLLGKATQLQGSPGGGIHADIDLDSETGVANYDATQNKTWVIDRNAPGPNVAAQDDDLRCCIFGELPATPDTCGIAQTSDLTAPAGSPQSILLEGRAAAKVACTLTQTATRNGETTTNTQSGTIVNSTTDCPAGEECTTSSGGFDAEGHFAGRNVSDGQQFEPDDDASPFMISASPGEVVELRIAFHNHLPAPVSDIKLFGPVPASVTFVKCDACQSGKPTDGTVTFLRGVGEAGGERAGTYQVTINAAPSGTVLKLTASVSSSAGTRSTNPVYITVE